VESATINIPKAPRNANLRAYLAGGGATAALVAAAVIVFVGVAAFVGFKGLPFGADDSPDATVNLAAGVPEAAARGFASYGRAIREGYIDQTSDAVEDLTGSPPRSLREVFEAHRGELLRAG
jgi:hypothetical protein